MMTNPMLRARLVTYPQNNRHKTKIYRTPVLLVGFDALTK